MPPAKTKSKRTPGSKTTNVKVVLELLKDVGKIGEAIPYLEAIAGLLKTVVEMKQEFTDSKEAWVKTMEGVREIQKIISDSLKDTGDRTLPIPEHLKEATAGLEACLVRIAEAFDRMNMKGCKRFFHRREIKADAEVCASDVARALQLFQTKLQIKGAVQMDNVHTIIAEGAITSVSGQATIAAQVYTIYNTVTGGSTSVSGRNVLPLCPSPSHFFTGRVSLLESLDDLFNHSDGCIATIIGKGGCGKTQLALKFVERQKSRFSRAFLVDASSEQTIQAAFGSIAKAHNAGSSIEDARNWFIGHEEEWLLIFDNADDPSLDLGQYIPRSSQGKIIITSRNHEVSLHASPDCSISLPDLDEPDAVDLLLKSARLKDSPDNRTLAADIVKELGYLALAISHAGAYISQSCPLRNYLSLFQSHRSNLLKRKRVQSPDGYSHTVFSALELSYRQLSETTKSFLHVVSFFHHSNIPLEIFPRAAARFSPDDSSSETQPDGSSKTQRSDSSEAQTNDASGKHPDLEDFLTAYCGGGGEWLPFSFGETISELQRYSIVSHNLDASTISLHSLIHACVGDLVDEKDTVHAIALELFEAAAPHTRSTEDDIRCMQYASHADHLWCTRAIPKVFSDDVDMRETTALIFHRAGSWVKEESMWSDILAIQRRVHGLRHPETLEAMGTLMDAYGRTGRLREAEELGTELLELSREVFGAQHPSMLASMGDVALIYHRRGKSAAAAKIQEEIVKRQRDELGEQHKDTVFTMGNLANTYTSLGRFEEALELEEKVLSFRRRTLGERHMTTLMTMSNLANTYLGLQRLEDAQQLQEEVLRSHKEILGEGHPDTWRTMGNLAETYRRLNNFSDAEQLDKKVLSLRTEVLGEAHPDTLTAKGNLAFTYFLQDRFKEAEPLQEEVLESTREVFGEQHQDTIRAMTNLGNTYCSLGRGNEAKAIHKKALRLGETVLGTEHPVTLRAMVCLVNIYQSLGQFREAQHIEKKLIRMGFLEEETSDASEADQ